MPSNDREQPQAREIMNPARPWPALAHPSFNLTDAGEAPVCGAPAASLKVHFLQEQQAVPRNVSSRRTKSLDSISSEPVQ
jgi:hypothetical protein